MKMIYQNNVRKAFDTLKPIYVLGEYFNCTLTTYGACRLYRCATGV